MLRILNIVSLLLVWSSFASATPNEIYLTQLDCKLSNGQTIKTTGVNSYKTTAHVDTSQWGKAHASVIDHDAPAPYGTRIQILEASPEIKTHFLLLNVDVRNGGCQTVKGIFVNNSRDRRPLADVECDIKTWNSDAPERVYSCRGRP